MLLREAVEGFMSGYFSTCRRSGKTFKAYRTDLLQLESRLGPATDVTTFDADKVEEWAADLRQTGYAPASIRRKIATTRVLFAYLMRKGCVKTSPFSRIRLDLGKGRVLPRCLTSSDAKRLIEQAWRQLKPERDGVSATRSGHFLSTRDIAAIEILFATGIRVGELVSLNVDDWCGEDSAFRVMGKGQRQRLALLPDDRSRSALRMYLSLRLQMDVGHTGFLLNASGQRISTQGVARIVQGLARTACLNTRVTPHMIRHTTATLLLRCGADIRVVQEVLGHASISTTQLYTHVSKEHLVSTLQMRHPNFHLGVVRPMQPNLPFG